MKLFKWLLGIIAALVVLVVVAAVVLPMFFDANDYRDTITRVVHDKTGRELRIDGNIELSVFPWLGVELGKMQLSNAPGFGDQPFARIERADVSIKLLPLLHKAVEMDTLTLNGLELNLARNAKGVTNWDDLNSKAAGSAGSAPAGKPAAAPAKPGHALAALAVGGVEVSNAKVTWSDAEQGSRMAIQNVDFRSGAVRLGEPFDMQLGFDVSADKPQVRGRVELKARASVDPNAQRYRLQKTDLSVVAQGDGVPGGEVDATLKADVDADLAAQTLMVDGLQLSTAGVTLSGKAKVEKLLSDPAYQASLNSNEFVPRDLMAALGVDAPDTADPQVLNKATLSLSASGGSDAVSLSNLKLRLDDTTLSGTASVSHFAKPRIRYDLSVDGIDADRYLPPAKKGQSEAATPATAAAGGALQLPLDLLRGLDVDGTVKVGKLKVVNLHSSELQATVKGKGGVFRVNPLGAKLYNGSYSGDLGLDVRSDIPKSTMDEKLAGVNIGPLLKDFMGKDYITGTANLSAKMSASGLDPKTVRSTLNGKTAFEFRDGMINGINVGLMIRKAYAAYKGQPAPADEPAQTDFAALSGTATVTDGLLRNDDLEVKSPLLRVNGAGKVDLAAENLDYVAKVAVVGSLTGQGGKELSELKGLTVPVKISGTFQEPKFGIDMKALLSEKVKQQVEQKKQEVKEKAKEKLQDELQKGLKGLLKF